MRVILFMSDGNLLFVVCFFNADDTSYKEIRELIARVPANEVT